MVPRLQRLVLLIVLLVGSLLGGAAPAHAGATQIDGTAAFQVVGGDPCPEIDGYPDYEPLLMAGSLTGCWYTDIQSWRITKGNVYLERGQELFVGSLQPGGRTGTFTTTYRFEAKLDADMNEVRGRCQHPLVAGSGTGVFAGATGRLDFKDIIEDPITYVYRGHLRLR
jgi:hypothetical protein